MAVCVGLFVIVFIWVISLSPCMQAHHQ